MTSKPPSTESQDTAPEGCGSVSPRYIGIRAAAITAPVSHQKRSQRDATNTIERVESSGKSTPAIFVRPLITVWLEVRVLPGPPIIKDLARTFGIVRERMFSFHSRVRLVNDWSSGPNENECSAGRPRSGRGGRRFKSCHSDQYLARVSNFTATDIATDCRLSSSSNSTVTGFCHSPSSDHGCARLS
jgi:hypothetical protein